MVVHHGFQKTILSSITVFSILLFYCIFDQINSDLVSVRDFEWFVSFFYAHPHLLLRVTVACRRTAELESNNSEFAQVSEAAHEALLRLLCVNRQDLFRETQPFSTSGSSSYPCYSSSPCIPIRSKTRGQIGHHCGRNLGLSGSIRSRWASSITISVGAR